MTHFNLFHLPRHSFSLFLSQTHTHISPGAAALGVLQRSAACRKAASSAWLPPLNLPPRTAPSESSHRKRTGIQHKPCRAGIRAQLYLTHLLQALHSILCSVPPFPRSSISAPHFPAVTKAQFCLLLCHPVSKFPSNLNIASRI